jgi:deoxyribose-phosphate aldolase
MTGEASGATTPPQAMSELDQLSGADLERVVTRVAELLATGGEARGGMWCFGDVCISGTVAREWIDMGVARLNGVLGGGGQVADVAAYIDHTLLKPTATRQQVRALCEEALKFEFASVCINPTWVKFAAGLLAGSKVKVCTVVGFPLGATTPDVKAMEARKAIRDGAREIDMVINVGALKSGDDDLVYRDIRLVVDACEDGRALSKVIIETALLSDDEKVRACQAARRARADFVKTSTGFASGGATAADVALMAHVVRGTSMGVKASGGVRNLADLKQMVHAGATRIGASAGVAIVKEASHG